MRITRLEAKNIGPFENLNIDFKPKPAGMENKAEIHILTGENGTGKSTILMMLASCADFDNDDRIRDRHNKVWEPIKRKSHRIIFSSSVYSLFYNVGENKDERFIPHELKKIEGTDEYSVSGKNQFRFNRIKSNKMILSAFFGYSSYRATQGNGIINIKEITSNPLENAVNFEKSIDSDLILDWVANVKTKELIARGKGNYVGNYKSAVQKIEKAISEIIDKEIEFDLEESLKVTLKINNKNLPFDVLPDGLKSIISWLSDLLMRLDRIDWADKTRSILEQNFILFLDEIEVHLHPSWQRKILPVVQDLFPNAQIFISTHSPFVVGSVDGARVYKFKLDENNNSYLDSEYWTEDGNSYDRILEEIFDIKERFGVGVQKQLEEFKSYKNKVMVGESIDNEAFMSLANDIAKQSIELNGIISFELRQLKKNTAHILETA